MKQIECFAAGTLVVCKNEAGEVSRKAIEEIEVGDEVWAFDEQTGVADWKKVLQLFRNQTSAWICTDIEVDGKVEKITSTPGHMYYLPFNIENRNPNAQLEHDSYEGLSEKWVSAEDLKKGDKVLLPNGRYGIVKRIKRKHLSEPETTYNLEIADLHTYYVGENGVCVHNAGAPCGGRGVNDLISDSNAQGAHSTFRTDATGKVTHYAEWTPNPKNPSGFDLVKRFDGIGGTHTNKITLLKVQTPHMHGGIGKYAIPGGVRIPLPWELPIGY